MTINSEQIKALIDQIRADIETRKNMPEFGANPDAALARINTINETRRSFTPETVEKLLGVIDADKELIAEQAKRIAELEASTLTVKLPRDITHVTNKYFEEGRDAVLEAIESQLAAAGITLDVGGG